MSFVALVENGAYSDVEEKLEGYDKGFINGIDYCIEQLDGLDIIPSDDDDALDKLRIDLVEKFIEDAKSWLYISRCEAIVAFGDEMPPEK